VNRRQGKHNQNQAAAQQSARLRCPNTISRDHISHGNRFTGAVRVDRRLMFIFAFLIEFADLPQYLLVSRQNSIGLDLHGVIPVRNPV